MTGANRMLSGAANADSGSSASGNGPTLSSLAMQYSQVRGADRYSPQPKFIGPAAMNRDGRAHLH
ncbi:hypothetical protein [Candidatus Mycobacterium methanotrophicum]|uniref:Uncharacterized protein n=1 Tax=Candidatus Mycobacterium methanotrophicum TaxID=2943498 RepID=A0ABY4QMD5_9MYCO|nr:hypothetical protein [Candidatus Mycobacterium methanotrophicum]UQX10944.1 hypothetical protein M5I08_23970 [Candidatus Mycobacterium methanotrophicum]